MVWVRLSPSKIFLGSTVPHGHGHGHRIADADPDANPSVAHPGHGHRKADAKLPYAKLRSPLDKTGDDYGDDYGLRSLPRPRPRPRGWWGWGK